MPFPAAPTEGGGAKLHFLTRQANTADGWFSVVGANNAGAMAVGFAAVATHVEGNAVASPGGLAVSGAPVVLVAGDDGTNAVPLQLDGGAGHALKVVFPSAQPVSQSGAWSVTIGAALPAGGNTIGGVNVLTLPSLPVGGNNIGDVDIASGPTGGSALQAQGTAASGAAKAGNPVQLGAVFNTTPPTVTTGQVVEVQATDRGEVLIAAGPQLLGQKAMAGSLAVVLASNQSAVPAQGDIAHDAADSGNPIKIGGKATTVPGTLPAASDRVNAWFDRYGRLVVSELHPDPDGPAVATLTAATDAVIVAAPIAGQAIYVMSIAASNGSATLTRLDIKEGSTTKHQMHLAANGGGYVHDLRPYWKLPAATALNGALAPGVTDVRVTVHYYVGPDL